MARRDTGGALLDAALLAVTTCLGATVVRDLAADRRAERAAAAAHRERRERTARQALTVTYPGVMVSVPLPVATALMAAWWATLLASPTPAVGTGLWVGLPAIALVVLVAVQVVPDLRERRRGGWVPTGDGTLRWAPAQIDVTDIARLLTDSQLERLSASTGPGRLLAVYAHRDRAANLAFISAVRHLASADPAALAAALAHSAPRNAVVEAALAA